LHDLDVEYPDIIGNWWEAHLRGFEAQMPKALMKDLRPLFGQSIRILKGPETPKTDLLLQIGSLLRSNDYSDSLLD
jgi:hypothetical protein